MDNITMKTDEEIQQQAKLEGEEFAFELNAQIARGEYLSGSLWQRFGKEMDRATRGRICTPERMNFLYPIFREINLEMDEIKRSERVF